MRYGLVILLALVISTAAGAGVVRNIERYGLEDGRVVPLARRVTETASANNTFLRQLLNNLGNFAADDFLD